MAKEQSASARPRGDWQFISYNRAGGKVVIFRYCLFILRHHSADRRFPCLKSISVIIVLVAEILIVVRPHQRNICLLTGKPFDIYILFIMIRQLIGKCDDSHNVCCPFVRDLVPVRRPRMF